MVGATPSAAETLAMQRRDFLATAAMLAAPAAVRAQSATTLRFTPQQDLVTLDPVTTTAYISRNHGFMVFDTLYGMDGDFKAHAADGRRPCRRG